MTHPFRVVAVSGGLQSPSKSAVLTEYLMDLIAEEIPSEQRLVELGQIALLLAGSTWRSELPDAVERELTEVEQARLAVQRALPLLKLTRQSKHSVDKTLAMN